MLAQYREMQGTGVIGPMVKDAQGQLVARPFAHYPKWVRKMGVRKFEDKNGEPFEKEVVIEFLAGSQSEELKWLSENPELAEIRSPAERDRDDVAERLSVQLRINGDLEQKLNALMAQVERLSVLDSASSVKTVAATESAKQAPAPLTVEQKAVLGKK